MKRITQYLTALTLGLAATTSFAAPQYLITNNLTNVESNAFIDGVYPSSSPSKANSVNMVPWFVVQLACYHHSIGRQCPATLKMATDTPTPIDLANVQINLDTGAVTVLSSNSDTNYKLSVNGIANVTLSE